MVRLLVDGLHLQARERKGTRSIRVYNGSNAIITGNHIGNNARAETGDGVVILGAGKVIVTGNDIGDFSDGSNAQRYGIRVATQTVPITVVGNDLSGNVTGVFNGTPPAGSVVRDNTGYLDNNFDNETVALSASTFNIAHGLSAAPSYALLTLGITAQDDRTVRVTAVDATNITGTIYDISSAAALTSGSHQIFWEARI